MKMNRSDGSMERETAAVSAEGPGITESCAPSRTAPVVNSWPGSLIFGVPASVTNAISAVFSTSRSFGILPFQLR